MKIDTHRHWMVVLYIFLYNVIMFVIHLKIFLKLLDAQISGRFDFAEHFSLFLIGTSAQILDIFHGIIGITNTGIAAALIQVLGRMFMLFVIAGNPHAHTGLKTSMLLLVWVLIELIRYPYYALRSLKVEIYVLTWLRYSAWIPLYPTGFLLEWLTMVSSLTFYYKSENFPFRIPYLQFSLNFAVFLAVLSFFVMPFLTRKLLVHMRKQRKNKLDVKKHQ
ncbi:hypothetical protein KIN20_018610 [Parelaphostrongylus tenuis]|uniref:Very-long-chain (3R)-3-hydroxyacyl-CoA dehydratase n=1 Tax=Parelaphostrongylus tenuis TaxID=148309 RepID=A0AAD5N4G2_PARTN|nr:hypothetical protein KIN20_018610 [Parelaphostrongylus tenuis]